MKKIDFLFFDTGGGPAAVRADRSPGGLVASDISGYRCWTGTPVRDDFKTSELVAMSRAEIPGGCGRGDLPQVMLTPSPPLPCCTTWPQHVHLHETNRRTEFVSAVSKGQPMTHNWRASFPSCVTRTFPLVAFVTVQSLLPPMIQSQICFTISHI